jgi:hypothetical protein
MFLSGCVILPQKAGIEIISSPSAKVFINGREAGMTPYKNNTMVPSEVEIKLVTDNSTWVKKIQLPNGVNTVIDRELGTASTDNGGYVLTLESTGDKEKAQLMINSVPDNAAIKIDGEIVGMSPLRLPDIGEGEKQITISLPRHKSITVLIRAIRGYQTVIDADLKEEVAEVVAEPTLAVASTENFGIIKETGTGWLRVRGQPNGQAAETGKVDVGTKHKIIDEQDGYYEIDLGEGKTGWVSTKYVEKL